MSHDACILAKQPLPPRKGGWTNDPMAPLWFAAVDIHVRSADSHDFLKELLDVQGGAAEILSLSFRHPAAEYADSYLHVLRRATGGAIVMNGVLSSKSLEPQPMSADDIERGLLEIDLRELGYVREHWASYREAESWREDLRERDNAAEDPPVGSDWPKYRVLCGTPPPGDLGLPESLQVIASVLPFMKWARRDTLRTAELLLPSKRVDYAAVVEVAVDHGSLSRDEESAINKALRSLADRTGGVLVEMTDD